MGSRDRILVRVSVEGATLKSKVFWLCTLAVLGVAAIAALHVPFPFYNDQASFTLGSSMVRHGGVMYVDFWDIKQPGIYAFFLLAGSMFGFNEFGIHTFEAIYWLVFAIVLMGTLRHRFSTPWVIATIPLLTIGMYYASAGAWHLTQVEALAGFPIYLTLWFSIASSESDRRRFALLLCSGIAGGFALLFKLLFLPILVTFWVIAISVIARANRSFAAKAIVTAVVAICCGVAMPIVATVLYFGYHHALEPLWQTTFTIPLHMLGQLPSQDVHVLLNGLQWFALRFSPVIALAILGVLISPGSLRNPLGLGLIGWVVMGLGVILIQTQSWWQYQFQLFFVPLGILAGFGLDAIVQRLSASKEAQAPSARVAIILALVILFLPACRSLLGLARLVEKNRFATDAPGRLAIYEAENPDYTRVLSDSTFLSKPTSLPGKVWVMGNSTLHYYLTGRKPAIAAFVIPPALLPDQIWEITRRFERLKPPYVYIPSQYADVVAQRYSETVRFLDANYRVQHSDKGGTWYRLSQ